MSAETKRGGDAGAGSLDAIDSSATSNGVPVGRFVGYLATWDVDLGGVHGVPDQFVRGAFSRSIAEHRSRGGRPIRMRYMHEGLSLIGSFPIEDVVEDDRGLRVVGEVNLETRQGREAWSLIKQGALSDLSIGFVALRDRFADGGRVRLIEEAVIREGSLVDEPGNRGARITSVKRDDQPASLAGILEELRDTTEMMRRGSAGGGESWGEVLAELKGATNELRRARESRDSSALRAILRDLAAMRASLRAA